MVVVGAASPKQEQWMKELGVFLNLLVIEYEDLGDGEDYILKRFDGEKLTLKAMGNKVDGAFLTTGRL